MNHPWNASRFRLRHGRRCGTIPVGTIVYLQDGLRPLVGFTRPVVLRSPWIVLAYRPLIGSFDGKARSWCDRAVVKCLRTGRTTEVGAWVLLAHDDAGFTRE